MRIPAILGAVAVACMMSAAAPAVAQAQDAPMAKPMMHHHMMMKHRMHHRMMMHHRMKMMHHRRMMHHHMMMHKKMM